MTQSSTGYGPRSRLLFDGNADMYELWETRFHAYLRMQKLLDVLQGGSGEEFVTRTALVYSELVQCLDDKSLSLIMRDAKDDGCAAMKLLQEYYIGASKPRIISLYTELTSLKMREDEGVTDYIIRAEKAATYLKNAGETISDSLLVAMLLKGLPDSFKSFSTVITQQTGDISFMKFKVALSGYEESEKSRDMTPSSDNVLNINNKSNIICFHCGKSGHKKFQCDKLKNNNGASSRWCNLCKNNTHDSKYCRKKNSIKHIDDTTTRQDDFAFKATHIDKCHNVMSSNDNLLVDCGATVHILNDESKFLNFEENFDSNNHPQVALISIII